MDLRDHSHAAPRIGNQPSRRDSPREGGESWPPRSPPTATNELSALERYDLLGWDEV